MPTQHEDGLTPQQRWARRNPEYLRQAQRKMRAANAERERARAREQYEKHRAKRLEAKRAYYQNVRKLKDRTPEGRFKDNCRKAKRRGAIAGDVVTFAEWQEIIDQHQGRCAYCGCVPEIPEQDHVKALTKGGRHIASNIVPACKPCNSSKGAR